MTARTITTAAELDALPVGSVVRTARGAVATRHERARGAVFGWLVAGFFGPQVLYADTDLPVVVLHDPSAPVVPVVSDAAVEAAGEALGIAWFEEGGDAQPPSASTIRAALTAALPFLGASPSATREDVARTLDPQSWDGRVEFGEDGRVVRAIQRGRLLQAADDLLARFTITPRTDR